MIAHSCADLPNECCGILVGEGDSVTRVLRVRNAEASPVRYSVDPGELLGVMKQVESEGLDIIGFYHSHTRSQAYPSATDKKLAFWPGLRYLIVSLEDPVNPIIRAFQMADGNVTEESIQTPKE
ncbi:MAG: M67 family metallopeptidase [Chloroflexi bacterium]|nr:M67 family metallopeptidase [Chloroflexota bacterium]